MTREEGLDWLYRLRSEIYVYMPEECLIPMNNALDMAIKALEHPEKNVIAVVPCGDAISRSDVLKLMQDNWHTHNGDWAMQESMDDIRALPSVTPQLSSELEKNSKKLEKDFGELDCISRADAIRVASGYCHPSNVAKELAKLPSVTPQEPMIVPIAEIKYDEDKLKELVNKCVLTVTPQDPSIIKIRAEIEAYANHATDEKQRIAFNSCLNLIDHYTELNPS